MVNPPAPLDGQWKTYVWEGVLTDYTDGMVVAVGRSLEEALEQIKKDAGETAFRECSSSDPYVLDPSKMETSECFYVWGGG
jgi:hypothetical protein